MEIIELISTLDKIIENERHTIFDKKYGVFAYNRYVVFEYCPIIECKEEIKHPTFKIKILKIYNIT